jgi:hypothetical protein
VVAESDGYPSNIVFLSLAISAGLGWFCSEFNHTFKHTYRFFFAFALAVRTLAAALDAFVAISFRRSGDSRAFRDFAPFFPILEK